MSDLRYPIWCLLLCAVLAPTSAEAINLNHHRSVTNVALKSFQLCLAYEEQTDLLTAGAHKILEGAKMETISPPLTRYFNWHFHDAYRDTEHAMGTNWLGVERSIHALHQSRLEELERAISSTAVYDIYETTGRLLNHLQQMSVPANVAPIHHEQLFDLASPDPFGEMIMWKSPQFIWQRSSCRVDDIDLQGLDDAIALLLDRTAERTRRAIRSPIDVPAEHRLAGKHWTEFWSLRDPETGHDDRAPTGFTSWGPEGAEGFPRLCQNDRDLCLTFFNARYADAVDASIKALMMINRVLLARQASEATD